MKRKEYQEIEDSYRYANLILICCSIIAVVTICLFINFLGAK